MVNPSIDASGKLRAAFNAHEARERLTNTKVGCILVITLMPAGSVLDYFVYHDKLWSFFQARILCSVIATVILGLLFTDWGKKALKMLGLIVPLLPVVFIAWMIYETRGFNSPYYAGLNLVLLAIGAVLHWTLRESVIAVSIVLGIYITAGVANGTPPDEGILVNNFYFIALMDLIVVVGTFFQHRQRYREFALRYELDLNKKELEISHAKLVELDRIKNRFFGNISHELRTPLTLLLAPLETLLAKAGREFGMQTRDVLATMQANGMRLLKLINDLLDLVRLESGKIQIKHEPVEVGSFIGQMAEAARQMAEDKQIHLATELAPEVGQVMLDRDKLEKVVLNLQFNSLKFTPRGGRVTLRTWREGNRLVLQVEDTGMGIPAQQLPHIFDRFWQADGTPKRKYQGVGIGLSLVKELVEAHGGSVAVTSEVNHGTTFTIHLPYVEASPTPAQAAAAPAWPADGPALPVAAAPARESSPEDSPTPVSGETEGTVSNQEWLSDLYRRAELFPTLQKNGSPTEETEEDVPEETEADAAPVAGDASPTARVPGKGAKLRLLVADDEYGMRQLIKSQLTDEFVILEAEDGGQAVNKAGRHRPDVILLDMMMPEKDGVQACREIRELDAMKTTPLIMLTARADEEVKLAALEAGANDFLSKPFSETELKVRIRNLVDSHAYQKELARKNRDLESLLRQLQQAETQLVESEKLASLGRMSAGIIHEINNPLNFASTGLFTLRKMDRSLEESEREGYREVLRDVEEGLNRVKTIVTDLRSFSHHDSARLERVEAGVILTTSLRFLSREIRDDIRVEQEVEEGLAFEGNGNRMIQVLVNLMQNAVDSMKAKEYQGEEPTLRIRAWAEDGRCRLLIRDNGMGIAEENRGKIFDPFFTTKDVGQGMGLGLSICYRIIKDHQGRMEVATEPGRYCAFQMDFPLSE